MFKDDTFQWRLDCLTDIFDSLNELNMKLQGRNNTIIRNYKVQEEFLEIKADSSMKDDFHLLTLGKFWIKRLPVNSTLASLALRILVPFSSTYVYETGFSALVLIKTKERNRLNVDSDMMIVLECLISTYSYFIQVFR
ncbi:unnamed protein product [Acanthoscelides obtectus]|uniref:HAT C-terminal dimerisation domain-containing protein n=1 Tax=Acanthoscelides obtectus TaxID=200917 RepID=A0A9P0PZD9_ACAOB|nr:unnamed protein product [Acanthoscelides obtectus]CAK1648256.1 Protein ZBED8 [Acanthoscelides obtectus]